MYAVAHIICMSSFPPPSHVIRDGQRQDIFARELVPGDIIICSVGDRIPADCRIIQVCVCVCKE